MDPTLVAKLIPVVGMVVTFGMPVAIVYVVHHFKYKRLELEAELEARRMISERDKAQLEARIERLESVILASVRPAAQAPVPELAAGAPDRALYEAPPLSEAQGASAPARRDPTR